MSVSDVRTLHTYSLILSVNGQHIANLHNIQFRPGYPEPLVLVTALNHVEPTA